MPIEIAAVLLFASTITHKLYLRTVNTKNDGKRDENFSLYILSLLSYRR